MTHATSDSFRTSNRGPGTSGIRDRTSEGEVRRRLYFGFAAIIAVTVWGLVSGTPAQDAAGFRQVTGTASDTGSEDTPVFDGRGKWGGYAR